MEHTKDELEVVAKLAEVAKEGAIEELDLFHLALVGGGIGDTIPH